MLKLERTQQAPAQIETQPSRAHAHAHRDADKISREPEIIEQGQRALTGTQCHAAGDTHAPPRARAHLRNGICFNALRSLACRFKKHAGEAVAGAVEQLRDHSVGDGAVPRLILVVCCTIAFRGV